MGVYCLALVPANTLPKTPLGGIHISQTKQHFLEGSLHPCNILMCPHTCVTNLPKPRQKQPGNWMQHHVILRSPIYSPFIFHEINKTMFLFLGTTSSNAFSSLLNLALCFLHWMASLALYVIKSTICSILPITSYPPSQ